MGKILKKKASDKKKKKKLDNGQSEQGVIADGKPKVSGDDSQTNGQKKQSFIQKKPVPPAKQTAGTQKQNFIGKSIQFLREVKAELKKVTWPSRKQTVGSTIVVVILVMIVSTFLWLVDSFLANIVMRIMQ